MAYTPLDISLAIPLPDDERRVIRWSGSASEYVVMIDGDEYARTDQEEFAIPSTITCREYLQVVDAADTLSSAPTPQDEVDLSWTGDADHYRIERAKDAGSYEPIANVQEKEYTDGPLEDATWHYKVIAIDAEGDETASAVSDVTISSAPEPPTNMEWSFDSDTGTLTLTWDASPSGDVSSYRVRQSAGSEELDWDKTPAQDSADTTYTQSFTTETGVYVFSVRAYDGTNEEGNVSQMVAIPFGSGEPVGFPAEPRQVRADPVSGGKVEVQWSYYPALEYLGPGQAHEARIYSNGGSGSVDWSSPTATVSMGGPESSATYSWTSGALTDGNTYKFGVRIATAANPDGVETTNSDVHEAVPNSDTPAQPTVTTNIV